MAEVFCQHGLGYLADSAPDCPFCQQTIDVELARRIAGYFDEAYERDVAEILRVVSAYDVAAAAYLQALSEIVASGSRYVDAELLQGLSDRLASRLELNKQHLQRKKKEPSSIVVLEDNRTLFEEVAALVTHANAAVRAHNETVDDIANQRALLTSQIWKAMIDEGSGVLGAYYTSKRSVDAAITGLNAGIAEKMSAHTALNAELRALERGITSVQPTVTEINGLLESFGFRGFKLETTGEHNNLYAIVRLDGSAAAHTLSEGEKTFITFLYFYHLIRGSMSESGVTTNRIVVIDDPVSSLDSDILFIVSSLIKRVFELSSEANSLIRQVFVLTHNIYFHKEVSFNSRRRGQCLAHETFWIVKKTDDGTVLNSFDHNPIKTSYELLWNEVRDPNRSKLTICNTLRRILENYFKILGNMDKDVIIEKFDGRDKVVCGSLFSWVNEGSHGAYDDLHLSTDDAAIETYLRVFRSIFEVTNHLAHYDMMMGNPPIVSTLPAA